MDRILVVDDEELNRDFLVHLLNDEFELLVIPTRMPSVRPLTR